MQKLLKSFAPKKPSSSCCASGKEQLTAAVVPPGDAAAAAADDDDSSTATTTVSNTYEGTKAADGGTSGDRPGWLRRMCCFSRCCQTSAGAR